MKTQLVLLFWTFLFFFACIGSDFKNSGEEKNLKLKKKHTIDSNSVVENYKYINESIALQDYFKVLDFEFPELSFIEKWNGWVVKDTTLDNPENYSIIEDYIGESNYKLFYTNDYLRIENRQSVVSEPLVVIEAKAFKTKESDFIIGIRYSYSSAFSFSDVGYKFFEISKDSTINDVTSSIFEEPALKDFFSKKSDFKKFKDYSCIQSSVIFKKDTDEFIMTPIFICENRCNTDKKYKQMCDVFKTLDKMSYQYKFKDDIGKFVLERKTGTLKK